MTRYTKLDGRRSVGTGTRPEDFGVDPDDYVDEPSTHQDTRHDSESNVAEPKALFKRAKLLRLKAKKAKSDEVRQKHLKEAKKLESMATHANGARGALGKRKGQGLESTRSSRPRLEPDQRTAFRRAKRAEERQAGMRCYVCRELSHSAKDCPHNIGAGAQGKDTVGLCFRCGSTEHTLSQCKKPRTKDHDDLPFATCYICTQKGHLASKCPQNQGRGVYPDGGQCKVCGSVEHLAKDCPMDPRRVTHASQVEAGGVGILESVDGAGADEDEFHLLTQRRHEAKAASQKEPRPTKKVVHF